MYHIVWWMFRRALFKEAGRSWHSRAVPAVCGKAELVHENLGSLWLLKIEFCRPYAIGRNGLGGHQDVPSPGALRLHPAFNELNLADWLINSELQEPV